MILYSLHQKLKEVIFLQYFFKLWGLYQYDRWRIIFYDSSNFYFPKVRLRVIFIYFFFFFLCRHSLQVFFFSSGRVLSYLEIFYVWENLCGLCYKLQVFLQLFIFWVWLWSYFLNLHKKFTLTIQSFKKLLRWLIFMNVYFVF